MELIRDLIEFIELLQKHEVRFMIVGGVVGGVAVNVLGFPRLTEDLDFWLATDRSNAANVVKTLNEFGFASLNPTVEQFMQSEGVYMFGNPPNRIDLLLGISGREFEDCYPRRVYGPLCGLNVPFISVPDLVANKRASARPKDLADVREFEKSSKFSGLLDNSTTQNKKAT
jgi:hypothetical protein